MAQSKGARSQQQRNLAAVAKERQQAQRQAAQEERRQYVEARTAQAEAITASIDREVDSLRSVLTSGLRRRPQVDLDSGRRRATTPPLDLGPLARATPLPRQEDFTA